MSKRRQSINHASTRLEHCPFNEEQNKETLHNVAQMQARTLEGKIDVDGKEVVLGTTPKVNGFSFVKTPSPAPGKFQTLQSFTLSFINVQQIFS